MADDIWSARDTALRDEDLVGFVVETANGPGGAVQAAAYSGPRAYLVVDRAAHGGGAVIVPHGAIERVDGAAEVVHLRCGDRELAGAPPFDAGREGDADYLETVGAYWGDNRDGAVA